MTDRVPFITVISDWSTQDYYCGALKGRILSQCPSARIIDLMHQVAPFSIAQAAFIVRQCFPNFPPQTVHLIAVNTAGYPTVRCLAAEYKGHYFLMADNGLLSLLTDKEIIPVYALEQQNNPVSGTFPELTLMADAAAQLASGLRPSDIGKPATPERSLLPVRPTLVESAITGTIVYIDSYENAISNISLDLFIRVGKGRPFEISVASNKHTLHTISQTYSDVAEGDMVAVFNSAGLLEIAINKGNAASLLSLSVNSVVRIKFLNPTV